MQRNAAAASTPSGAPPIPRINIDTGFIGIGRVDDAGDVTVGDQAHRSAGFAHRTDQIGVARPIEDHGGDRLGFDAFGFGQIDDVFVSRCIEIDNVFRVTRPHRDLVHIDVGCMQKRAVLRQSERGDGARHILGAKRRALQWIDRNIDFRSGSGADLLADEQHRRLIHLALADHNRAIDRKAAEFAAHGIDGGLVGFLFRAATAQPGGGNCGALGHPHYLKRQSAIEAGILTDRL
jgi:hypothetical protein